MEFHVRARVASLYICSECGGMQ